LDAAAESSFDHDRANNKSGRVGDTSDSDFSIDTSRRKRGGAKKRRKVSSDSDTGSDEDNSDVPLSQRLMASGGGDGGGSAKRSARRRIRQGGSKATTLDENEDVDMNAAKKLLAKVAGSKFGTAGTGGARGGFGGGASSTHDPEVRRKVKSLFQQTLELAVKEIEEDAEKSSASISIQKERSPAVVAASLEDALVRLYGACIPVLPKP